jgi:hypothetical protein
MEFTRIIPSLTRETEDKLNWGKMSIDQLEELYFKILAESNKYKKMRVVLQRLFFLSFLTIPLRLLVILPLFWFDWRFQGATLFLLAVAILYQLFYLFFERTYIYRLEKQFLKGLRQGYPKVEKERFTLNRNFLSAINCKNCGANGFAIKGDKIICDYCNTVFSVRGRSKECIKISYIERAKVPILRMVLIFLGLVVFIPSIVQEVRQVGGRQVGAEMAHVVEGWSEELFEGIQLAERQSLPEGGQIFADGDAFSDLSGKLPNPHSISTDVADRGTQISYVWRSGEFEYYDFSVRIVVDEESGLIIRKSARGYERFRVRGEGLTAVLGFENIERVEGWTQSIYEDIIVATELVSIDADGEREWNFVDGSYIQELEELVGRPGSVFVNNWNGTITNTWNSIWEPGEVSVHIDVSYCEETGMITQKRINAWR